MKDTRYIVYIGLLASLLLILVLTKDKQYDWRVTYAHEDKNPYGTYALNQLFASVFDSSVKNSYQTLYELKDSLSRENIVILSGGFGPDKEDTKILLNYVEEGGHVFIAADYFHGSLADTLGLETSDSFFDGENPLLQNDSAFLHFVSAAMDSSQRFSYRRNNIHNYFSRLDSVHATVIAKNDFHQPVALRIVKGTGSLILSCTPMIFTNIYLLKDENHKFASSLLSYLPKNSTYRTEYYHLGRMEAATPLRFILTTEPLRWAYYISIVTLLIFILFESKRKQRVIPILNPLVNSSIEFVGTLGNLYFGRGDHKNIAGKKILFLFDQIRTQYLLNPQHRDEELILALAKKSGATEQTVRELMTKIDYAYAKEKISTEELIELNKAIENFHQKK